MKYAAVFDSHLFYDFFSQDPGRTGGGWGGKHGLFITSNHRKTCECFKVCSHLPSVHA